MGIITVSIDDKIEEQLRRLARARFNKKKGELGAAINEALKEWAEKKEQASIEEGLELLRKGINMGGMITKKREDWHRR